MLMVNHLPVIHGHIVCVHKLPAMPCYTSPTIDVWSYYVILNHRSCHMIYHLPSMHGYVNASMVGDVSLDMTLGDLSHDM